MGVPIKTLQRWDRDDILRANRTLTNKCIILKINIYNLKVYKQKMINEELVQDITSILHVFSCKLYGLKKYKKQIKEDKEIAKKLQNGNWSHTRTNSKN